MVSVPEEERPGDAKRPESLRAYQEWSDHRYDPGHYLGGNPQPHLDMQRLGPAARKRAGMLIGMMAAMSAGVGLVVWTQLGTWGKLYLVGWVALMSAAAIRMYRS